MSTQNVGSVPNLKIGLDRKKPGVGNWVPRQERALGYNDVSISRAYFQRTGMTLTVRLSEAIPFYVLCGQVHEA